MQGNPSQRLMACIAMAFIGHGAHAATTHHGHRIPGHIHARTRVSTFAELVRIKSGGEVIIEASYDAAKGIKSGDMIAAVQTRKVDAGDAFAGALAEKYPLFGVSSLPFLADSLAKARSLNKTARPAMKAAGRTWPEVALHHAVAGLGHLVQAQDRRPGHARH